MDDQRNRFGQKDDETSRGPEIEKQPSSENSTYYYSYGPFKSVQNEAGIDEDPLMQRDTREVEVTTPQPVKPMPSRLSSESGGGSSSGKPANRHWNYNDKRGKGTVKTVLLSFLAGMLVIAGLMFAADRTNLFTPEANMTTAADSGGQAETAADEPSASNETAQAASAQITSNPGDVASVASEASPAVVLIETLVKTTNQSQTNPYSNDPFYRYFFGDQNNRGSSSQNGGNNNGSGNGTDGQLQPSGIGSGFIFDKSGYILTNEHVIHGADVIQVTVQGTNKPYEAKLLGSSYELDIAVLKIEGDEDFPTVEMGSSDDLQVGEWLVAIGNPHGFEHTVTAGVLSSTERDITIAGENGEADRNYEHLLQTDASINSGNSGGPLLNLKGEVIGMNVAVSAEAQGIGFAIPSKTITEVLDYLKNNQEIPKEPEPFVGVGLVSLTPQVSQQLGTDVTEGSFVESVVFKSPAYEADVRQYDIIVGADGEEYGTAQDLIEYIQTKKVGDKITLNIVRNGKSMEVSVTIGDKNDYNLSSQE